MVRMIARPFLLLAILPLLTATPGRAATPARTVAFPRVPSGRYVVLGTVLSAHSQAVSRRGPNYGDYLVYKVRVLCAISGGAKVKGTITIDANRTPPGTRSWAMYPPIMKPGVCFIMGVDPPANGSFRYADGPGGIWMPFGICRPSAVRKGDVARLEAAMRAYVKLAAPTNQLISAQIAKFCHSKNYFLWALGTWASARTVKGSDVGEWLARLEGNSYSFPFKRKMLSPRRAFWLAHCIENVVPKAARPSPKGLSDALTSYLQQLATPAVPGYKN